MKSVWKDIVGYEGLYQVSSLGEIRSVDRYRKGKKGSPTFCKGSLMTLSYGRHGYLTVGLSKDCHCKRLLVHRLVAEAFVENSHGNPVVDHINGDRLDNKVENLRWCTTKENMNFDIVRRNISHIQKTSKRCIQHQKEMQDACRKPVVIISTDGAAKIYLSLKEVEEDGFNRHTVSGCCNSGRPIGKHKFKGYKCYWKEDYEISAKMLSEKSK